MSSRSRWQAGIPAAVVVLAITVGAAISGCATITKGTTQPISLNTPGAPGAQCTLFSNAVGTKVVTTPATIVLDKSQESITVSCKKECFQDGTGVIASSTETMAAGNILVGGVVGLGVDAVSGAMNKYNQDNQIAMVPIQGCKPRG
jgi:uncharacterized protein YceK